MSLCLMKRLAHMDLEVARPALSRNLKFNRNTTRPSRSKTSPYFFGWLEGMNMRRKEVGSMPIVSAMTR
jgi:hypothetical protein